MPLKPNAHAVDADIRAKIFDLLNIENVPGCSKVNDRQYGVIIEDQTGTSRYARIGVIVAKADETITAQEMMENEHNEYLEKKRKSEELAAQRAKKAADDKARRAAKKEEKD